MDTRTNNFVESFHKASINTAAMARHPSIWLFVRHLKVFRAGSAERGIPRAKRKRKWGVLEENLLRLKGQYVNRERNLHSYWFSAVVFNLFRGVTHLL